MEDATSSTTRCKTGKGWEEENKCRCSRYFWLHHSRLDDFGFSLSPRRRVKHLEWEEEYQGAAVGSQQERRRNHKKTKQSEHARFAPTEGGERRRNRRFVFPSSSPS